MREKPLNLVGLVLIVVPENLFLKFRIIDTSFVLIASGKNLIDRNKCPPTHILAATKCKIKRIGWYIMLWFYTSLQTKY